MGGSTTGAHTGPSSPEPHFPSQIPGASDNALRAPGAPPSVSSAPRVLLGLQREGWVLGPGAPACGASVLLTSVSGLGLPSPLRAALPCLREGAEQALGCGRKGGHRLLLGNVPQLPCPEARFQGNLGGCGHCGWWGGGSWQEGWGQNGQWLW